MADFDLNGQIILTSANASQAIRSINRQLQNVQIPRGLEGFGSSLEAGFSGANRQITATAGSLDAASASVDKLSTSQRGAIRGQNNLNRSVSQGSANIEDFADKAGIALRRFTAFTLASGVAFGSLRAITQATRDAIDFERELLKVAQVADTLPSRLGSVRDTIRDVGVSFGVEASSLVEAARIFSQAGLSISATNDALRAVGEASLAPTIDDQAQAVQGLIAISRQFGVQSQDFRESLGQINAVSGQFAVEFDDIIQAVQRAGGVFAQASQGVATGNDALAQFIALFTSVRATSRESSETIATGLRTIIGRLQRPGNIEFFREIGVELTNANGQFVGAFEAIQRIGQAIQQLPERDIRLGEIVERFGGLRQISRAIPLLQQTTLQTQALSTAQRGANSTATDAALAQQNLAVQLEQTRQQFDAFIRGIEQTASFQLLARGANEAAQAILTIGEALDEVIPILVTFGGLAAGSSILRSLPTFLRRVSTNSSGFTRRQTGGPVPGSGTGDKVPILAEPGEFVLRRSAVESLGLSNVERLNNIGKFKQGGLIGGGLPRFKTGGVVGTPRFQSVSTAFETQARRLGATENSIERVVQNVNSNFDNIEDATKRFERSLDRLIQASERRSRQEANATQLRGGGTSSGGLNLDPRLGNRTEASRAAEFAGEARESFEATRAERAEQERISQIVEQRRTRERADRERVDRRSSIERNRRINARARSGVAAADLAAIEAGALSPFGPGRETQNRGSSRAFRRDVNAQLRGRQIAGTSITAGLSEETLAELDRRQIEETRQRRRSFVRRGRVSRFLGSNTGQLGLLAAGGAIQAAVPTEGVGGAIGQGVGGAITGGATGQFVGQLAKAVPGLSRVAGLAGPVGAAIGLFSGLNRAIQESREQFRQLTFDRAGDAIEGFVEALNDTDTAFQDIQTGAAGVLKQVGPGGSFREAQSLSDGGIFGSVIRESRRLDATLFGRPDGVTDQALNLSEIENNLISREGSFTERLGIFLGRSDLGRILTGGAFADDTGRLEADVTNRAIERNARERTEVAEPAAQAARTAIEQLIRSGRENQITDELRVVASSDDFGVQRGGSRSLAVDQSRQREEIIRREIAQQQRLARAASLYRSELDNLTDSTDRVNALLGAFSAELGVSTNILGGIASRATGNFAEVTGTSVNPFSNLRAASAGDISGAIASVERGTGVSLADDIFDILQSNIPLRGLGNTVREAANRERNLGAGGGEALRNSILSALSSGPLSDLPDVLTREIRNSLDTEGAISDQDVQTFERTGDLPGLLAELAPTLGQVNDAFENTVNALIEAQDALRNAANQRTSLLNQRIDLFQQADTASADFERFRAGLGGGSLSPERAIALGNRQVAGLTGGITNPQDIVANIARLEQRRAAINADGLVTAGESVELSNLNSALSSNNEALGILSDNVLGLADIQSELARIEQQRVAAQSSVLDAALQTPEQRLANARGREALGILRQGGDLDDVARAGFNRDDLRRGVRSTEQAFELRGDTEGLNAFRAGLTRNLARDVDADTAAVLDRVNARGLGGGRESELRGLANQQAGVQQDAINARIALLEAGIETFDAQVQQSFTNAIARLQEATDQFNIPENITMEINHSPIQVSLSGASLPLAELGNSIENKLREYIDNEIRAQETR